MNIEDFVRESLIQVVKGVAEANRKLEKIAQESSKNAFGLSPGQAADEGRGIEFDLAVTVSQEAQAGAKASNFLQVVVDFDAAGSKKNSVVSRIRFRVSVDKWIR